jgi:hypothetical protein
MVRTHLTWLRDATILMNHRRRDMRIEFEMNIQPDQPSINGRIYSKEICDKMMEDIKKLQYLHMGSPVFDDSGLFKDPDIGTFAAKVEDVRYEGSNILIDTMILDTPCGKDIKKLLEEKPFSVCCTPAGIGSINENKIANDYQITSVHIIPKERQA